MTENGIATADDTRRVAFIEAALAGVQNCIADGIPVKGYFHWSLMDNFEWQKGYAMNFGLIAVNRETMERTPKPSLAVLGGYANAKQHRIIPALRLKHRSGGCGTASALPKCSIIHKVLSALWLSSCRTSLAVSALRIMRYCHKNISGCLYGSHFFVVYWYKMRVVRWMFFKIWSCFLS